MKKILVAALLLASPAFAMAQKSGERRTSLTPQQRAEKQTARVDAAVGLTAEQRQKITAENLRAAQAMQPHIENMRAEKKAMHAIGKQRRDAYAKILTPDQMTRLKALHKERRLARGENGGRALRQGRMQKAPQKSE
jgi:hypothetical protein